MPDGKAKSGSQPLLFPAENPKRSGKGTWYQRPGGVYHTLTGSPETAKEISIRKPGSKGNGYMRGKQPKEREKYVIRMGNGTLVEVDREIYLEWYRSERRERYQKERDRKHGVCSMEALEEKGCFPEMATMNLWNVTEENALYNIYRDKLMKAIGRLPKQDAQLIKLIYFDECTVKKTAEILGCNRKSIENRKKRIFRELCRMIEKF